MRNLPKPKLAALVLALAAFLAVPAAANATLTYTMGLAKPKVYLAADNGSGAKSIGAGRNSRISPDGETVIYERETKQGAEMRLYSVAVHKSQRLLNPWTESFVFAWSPDSELIAAITGPLNGKQTLLVINTKTTVRTKIATGYFNGVSFSPSGEELVYGVSATQNYPLKSDIYRVAVDGTGKVALSHDHNSAYPLWGPKQIVFARQLGAAPRKYGPANQLFLMNEQGGQVSRLTHTKVDPLAQGLVPLAFNKNGNRLLTEFGGQDQSYGVAVSTLTGAEKKLTKDPETGFQASALSADGSTILGTTGLGFGGNPKPKIVTQPWGGGAEKVLVANAYEPSWSVE
jgi:Tol biopolymer transport system component